MYFKAEKLLKQCIDIAKNDTEYHNADMNEIKNTHKSSNLDQDIAELEKENLIIIGINFEYLQLTHEGLTYFDKKFYNDWKKFIWQLVVPVTSFVLGFFSKWLLS